jgi:hypothetical protein
MSVKVMHVRCMGMSVFQRTMPVPVSMWLSDWIVRPMHMLVMLVMDMRVGVRQRLVSVLMLVTLSDVEPHSQSH